MKSKFGVVLIKPQLGENIGSCARSMKILVLKIKNSSTQIQVSES